METQQHSILTDLVPVSTVICIDNSRGRCPDAPVYTLQNVDFISSEIGNLQTRVNVWAAKQAPRAQIIKCYLW